MVLTLTEAIWKNKRPKSAKGSGVAAALGQTAKNCTKTVNTMTAAEVKAAGDAVAALDRALATAQGKIASDKGKDALAAAPLMRGWRTECSDYQKELSARTYVLNVGLVAAKFAESFATMKQQFDRDYADAKAAKANIDAGRPGPTDAKVVSWMGTVRDMTKMATKGFVPAMSGVPEAKTVKPGDVPLPDGVKEVKPKLVELTAWCTEFAKAAKKSARTASASVGDVSAADKEVKSILADYQSVESQMKPYIKRAESIAPEAALLADNVKQAIAENTKDIAKVKGYAAALKRLTAELKDLDDRIKVLNQSWRESTGAIAVRSKAAQSKDGYDQAQHGDVIKQRMNSNMMSIRRTSMHTAEAKKQIDRASRHFQSSGNFRGYM